MARAKLATCALAGTLPSMARAKSGQSSEQPSEVAPQHLHLWQIQAVRDVIFIAAAVTLVWLGYAMRTVTVPLLVALLLAYLFEPLVVRLSRHPRLTRPMVVGGLLLTVGAGFILVVAITVPLLISQTMQLIDDFRAGRFTRSLLAIRDYVPEDYRNEFDRVAAYLTSTDVPVEYTEEKLNQSNDDSWALDEENTPQGDHAAPPHDDALASEPIPSNVAKEIDALRLEIAALRTDALSDGASKGEKAGDKPVTTTSVLQIVRRGIDVVFAVIGEIIAIGLLAFLIPFYFFFFSVWYPSVVKFGSELIPPDRRDRVTYLLQKMDRAVAGFVRGRIVISLIMGAMLALGWQIVGVQYAIVLGFVIGFFSIVPYLGGIGLPLAIALLWLGQAGEPESQRMAWYMILLWPSLVFIIVQIVEGYVLTPAIAGKATNLDPVTILVAVLAGGAIMGVYGMLLAIPAAACLKILFVEVLLPRIKEWSAGNVEDPLPIERD